TAARSAALARIAEQQRLARLTRHGELIAQRATPTLMLGRARVALPPGCFLQATAAGEAALAGLVTEACGDAERVVDLLAGVRPLALRLAGAARVIAAGGAAEALGARQRAEDTTPGREAVDGETRRQLA